MRVTPFMLAMFGGLIWSRLGAAETRVAAEPPLVMPAFVVNDDRVSWPKWRYIAHRDFEILFLMPDKLVIDIADQFAKSIELLDVVIPPAARLRLNAPASFIFAPQKRDHWALMEAP